MTPDLLFTPIGPPIAMIASLWYAVPLIVCVSLVYGATRQELMRPILEHALRFGAWVAAFMGAFMALVMLLEWLA